MFFTQLVTQTSTASTILFIALVGIAGIMLGKVNFFNFKLGIAGVLFVGLLVGHFGANINPEVLHFIKEFGLILFIYSIGIEVGPRFMSSFRNNGITLNLLAIGIILLGLATAYTIKLIFHLDIAVIAGLMCGGVTNTPSLGAAQSILTDQFANGNQLADTAGMAYAVAYPFGIIGIILAMAIIRIIFKVKISDEQKRFVKELEQQSGKALSITMEVTNPHFYDQELKFIKLALDEEFVFSRILRNGDYVIPDDTLIVKEGDIFIGNCSKENIPLLELKVGKITKREKIAMNGDLSMRHIIITNRKISGHTIKDINLSGLYPANITRIFRGESEIIPNANNFVEFGDTVRVVGQRDKMDNVAKFLGNSQSDLSSPNLVPLFIGIFLGIILGSIPFFVPGLPAPAKLGLAGGPLIVSLILGHYGRIGKFDFYMTPSANLFIRELGIVLFLGCVGIGSGQSFIETITNGGYMWMLYAAMITFLPIMIVGCIARSMNINYLTICGVLAGSMTDPPALEYANNLSSVHAQSRGYATVYPVSMFLRILCAQILILFFL